MFFALNTPELGLSPDDLRLFSSFKNLLQRIDLTQVEIADAELYRESLRKTTNDHISLQSSDAVLAGLDNRLKFFENIIGASMQSKQDLESTYHHTERRRSAVLGALVACIQTIYDCNK